MFDIQISKKSFFGASLGTMVEYYDYALFIIFLPMLSHVFFPASTAYQSLVKGFIVLSIAMIARPLGGIFFGYIGDTMSRRKALLASMYGIAFATITIGITPSTLHIGIWATIIIILAKSIQLFCFGGEYSGAGIYVVEHAAGKREALMGSLLSAMTLFGSLIASVVGVILTLPFMPDWSWRIAFILGGAMGIIGIFYRKNMIDIPHFQPANKQESFLNLIKKFPKEILAGIFIGGSCSAPITTVLTFIDPVLMTKGYFSSHYLMLLQTVLISFGLLTLFVVGSCADKLTPNKVMKFACWVVMILSYPILLAIDTGNLFFIVPALIALVILNELFLSPSNAYFKNLFPMQYRYRGSSLGFCVGVSLFAGLTPLVESYLYHLSGHFSSITLWLMSIAAGTFFTLRLVEKKQASFDLATVST
ncbi:MAG: MFS transporter [Gammaproteobacteria bacterium]|nr:MFS transporter [Gammaproteobacteria bacterium]